MKAILERLTLNDVDDVLSNFIDFARLFEHDLLLMFLAPHLQQSPGENEIRAVTIFQFFSQFVFTETRTSCVDIIFTF